MHVSPLLFGLKILQCRSTLPASKISTNCIRSVTIEGFRSLRHIQKLELPQLTLLIRANGANKSTFDSIL